MDAGEDCAGYVVPALARHDRRQGRDPASHDPQGERRHADNPAPSPMKYRDGECSMAFMHRQRMSICSSFRTGREEAHAVDAVLTEAYRGNIWVGDPSADWATESRVGADLSPASESPSGGGPDDRHLRADPGPDGFVESPRHLRPPAGRVPAAAADIAVPKLTCDRQRPRRVRLRGCTERRAGVHCQPASTRPLRPGSGARSCLPPGVEYPVRARTPTLAVPGCRPDGWPPGVRHPAPALAHRAASTSDGGHRGGNRPSPGPAMDRSRPRERR